MSTVLGLLRVGYLSTKLNSPNADTGALLPVMCQRERIASTFATRIRNCTSFLVSTAHRGVN